MILVYLASAYVAWGIVAGAVYCAVDEQGGSLAWRGWFAPLCIAAPPLWFLLLDGELTEAECLLVAGLVFPVSVMLFVARCGEWVVERLSSLRARDRWSGRQRAVEHRYGAGRTQPPRLAGCPGRTDDMEFTEPEFLFRATVGARGPGRHLPFASSCRFRRSLRRISTMGPVEILGASRPR